MITLTIDNQKVQAPEGTTILDAAKQLDIHIPTLCYADGFKPSTSCMVCVVRVEGFRHLLPACGTRVTDNMVVTTDSDEINTARKTAIELLLSDHVGDCVGPCEKGCPANMNIPLMIRQITAGQFDQAIATVKKDIPLPAILGRICSAPCEKVCRRAQADGAVSICLLKRFVADVDLASNQPFQPQCQPSTGKKVAIIGAGPCGLSAAYYLACAGIDCTLFDKRDTPGGSLLDNNIDRKTLPLETIEKEIEQIVKLGVEFKGNKSLGTDVSLDELKKQYDAVLLAIGNLDSNINIGIDTKDNKIPVTRPDYATTQNGVFAAGTCIGSRNLPIRAVADGKEAALSIQSTLCELPVSTSPEYNHRMGRLEDEEIRKFMQTASPEKRTETQNSDGFAEDQARRQAARCLHCDCRKAENCKLRDLATETGARQKTFETQRKLFEQMFGPGNVIFEPGKCVKCGLCIQTAKNAGEELGLSFEGRGFEMRVTASLNKTLMEALKHSADECVKICPTGAISIK